MGKRSRNVRVIPSASELSSGLDRDVIPSEARDLVEIPNSAKAPHRTHCAGARFLAALGVTDQSYCRANTTVAGMLSIDPVQVIVVPWIV